MLLNCLSSTLGPLEGLKCLETKNSDILEEFGQDGSDLEKGNPIF